MTASASGAGTSPQKQSLPFCELHVHLEGTLEPDAIFGLAERNRITLPYRDIDDLSTRYEFTDLQSFLNLYYDNLTVLRKEGDYFYLALRYLRRAHQGGVRHVEMFVDPQAHEARGVSTESVLRGVSAAISEAAAAFGMTAAIIVCVVRDMPVRRLCPCSMLYSRRGYRSQASGWIPPRSVIRRPSSAKCSKPLVTLGCGASLTRGKKVRPSTSGKLSTISEPSESITAFAASKTVPSLTA
jgi:hypothetical protein